MASLSQLIGIREWSLPNDGGRRGMQRRQMRRLATPVTTRGVVRRAGCTPGTYGTVPVSKMAVDQGLFHIVSSLDESL